MDAPVDQVPLTLAKLIEDPVGTVRSCRVTQFVTPIPDGWRVPADAFTGAEGPRYYLWKCEGKVAVWVRGTMTDVSRTRARLVLQDAPRPRQGLLDVEGQACDKLWCPNVPIQILINKTKVFDGVNPFVKQGWSRAQFPFPAGTLRRGENVIEIRNLADSDSLISHWCMISEVLVRFPDGKSD